jgi:hypothetical protein
MTSPANEMYVFLWQIGTVIHVQRDDGANLPEEYIQFVVITLEFSHAISCLVSYTCSAKADFPLFKVETVF